MLSKFSVKKPFTVAVAVVLVIVLGVISFTSMTTDLLPKIDLPYVLIMTTYPGATPEKVETTLTKPIEQAVATVGGIHNITSVSQENASMVILEFENGTNMESTMIDISAKIDMVEGYFDETVSAPMILKLNPDMMPVMVASVDYDGKNLEEISHITKTDVTPEFERIGGVASVTPEGIVEKRITITLDQAKIDALNERVLQSVDSELADAEKELKKARAELENGKKELEEKGGDAKDKLAEGGFKVVDGIAQAEMGKGTINLAITGIEKSLDEVYPQRNQFAKLIKEKKAVEAEIAVIESEYNGMPIDTIPPMLQQQIAVKQQALNSLVPGSSGYEALLEDINNDKAELARVNAVIARRNALNEAVTGLGYVSAEDLETALGEIDSTIEKLEEQLKELKKQRSQLNSAMGQLEDGYTELEKGKFDALGELTKADIMLTMAEEQLKKGEEEFEKARDEAYEKAGLDGVITKSTISGLITAGNLSMPAGSINSNGISYTVKVGDAFASFGELQQLVLFNIPAGDIGDIRICDVAAVEITDNSDEIYTKINGNDGVLISLQKQSTSSTSQVSDELNETIKRLEKEYPGLHITPLMDQGMYIDMIINSVLENLLMGAVLAIIVLVLFLKSMRPTVVVACSIPISLLFAVALMYFTGVTMNIISLSGLALGVGMLVDNSIVVIENIYRLRQQGIPAAKAAVYGAKQVAGAIFASTLTTVCVFLPIVFTQGLSRQLFTDMGLTIGYSLMASLVVALTVVPVVSAKLFEKSLPQPFKFFDKIAAGYAKLLRVTLKHKAPVLIASVVLLVISAVSVLFMGTAFIPEMDSVQMTVSITMPEGATEDEGVELSSEVVNKILAMPDVDTVGTMRDDEGAYTLYVLLKEDKKISSSEAAKQINEMTKDLDCEVSAQGSMMDISMLGGSGVQVVIKGNDLDTLRSISTDVSAKLSKVEGVAAVDDGQGDTSPEMRISVDKAKAMGYTLTVGQIFQQVTDTLTTEKKSTTVTINNAEYPVIIASGGEGYTPDTLEDIVLKGTKEGEETDVALGDIADITTETSLNAIKHDNQVRTITVTANIDGDHNIGLVSRDIETALEGYTLPDGYSLEFAGENETINQALSDLVLMVLLAVVFIYLIMVAQFQSLLSPFIVIFTIPLAFTGGLLALLITGKELSVISMLGFLLLAGIIVNNGIVFVDYANQLRAEGMNKQDALVVTGKNRLRPILMTAITTIFGLVTMAMGLGAGGDMVQPLAIVTIGGLTYATLLTLFVVPCLYDILNRKPIKKVDLELAESELPTIADDIAAIKAEADAEAQREAERKERRAKKHAEKTGKLNAVNEQPAEQNDEEDSI